MTRLRQLYRVPPGIRLLAAGAAVAVLVSLPALASSGSKFGVFLVASCGMFSASIALFGRRGPAVVRGRLRT